MAQFYSHITTRRTAKPRNGRLLDALQQGGSQTVIAGGTQGEQLWRQYTTTSGSAVISPVNGQLAALLFPGDVVAYSVNKEIPPVSFPIASYMTQGILSVKQGSGLFVNDGVLSLDPSVIGGGGLDEEKLKEYLTANKYYNYQSQLTGYSIAAEYSPITPTDTILTAFGKLEKNFSNYVDLKTNQTIDGVKTFKQTIISQGDVIAYSTGSTPVVSLPIASATTLGVIKVGKNLKIDDDGTLNGMAGGITSVSWGDITGSLADQADLWATLNNKVDKTSYTAQDVLAKLKTVDGSGSGLDADLLDGIHSSGFAKYGTLGAKNLNDFSSTETGIYTQTGDANATSNNNYPEQQAGLLITGLTPYGNHTQIYGTYRSNRWYARCGKGVTDAYSSWREFAFTDSTVEAAKKLANKRYLWGRPFDGTANVIGSLELVTSIVFDGVSFKFNILNDGSSSLRYTGIYGWARGYNIVDADENVRWSVYGMKGDGDTLNYSYYGGTFDKPAISILFSNKYVGINTLTPNEALHVIGNIKSSQNIIAIGDVIAYSTGSTPSVSFPIASSTTLGVIKVGANLSVGTDGTLNALPQGLTSVNWGMIEGSISAQTDLQQALNAKLNASLYTAADILSKVKTVDGAESGLDADLLDGKHCGSKKGEIPFIIPFPVGSSEFDSTDTNVYLSKVLGWAYEQYAVDGSDRILWGAAQPNVRGNMLMHLYPDALDENGYPKYSSGLYIPLSGSKQNPICFGTYNYTYYQKAIAFLTDTVEAANKLATARTLWGQSFDGTSNVSGNMTGVGYITSRDRVVSIRNVNNTEVFLTNAVNNNTEIRAIGGNIVLGYRGTNAINFYGGQTVEGEVGSLLGSWTTVGLCIGGTSHNAKLHVEGDIFSSKMITSGTGLKSQMFDGSFYTKIYSGVGGWARGYYVKDSEDAIIGNISSVLGSGDSIKYFAYGGTNYNAAAMYILANKNVGIGTTIASEKLSVNGNIWSNYNILANGNIIAQGDVVAYSTGNTPSLDLSVSWSQITGKPSTFAPTAHTHDWSQVTNKPNVLSTVTTSGSGNVVTGVTYSGSTIKVTKGTISASWNGGTISEGITISNSNSKGIYLNCPTPFVNGNNGLYLQASGTNRLFLGTYQAQFTNLSGGVAIIYSSPSLLLNGDSNGEWKIHFSSSNNKALTFTRETTQLMRMGTDGVLWVYKSVSEGSDMRYKTKLNSLYDILPKIMGIDVFDYYLNDDEQRSVQIGVSAQQLKPLFPELVSLSSDRYSVAYNRLGCIAIQGLKELYTRHQSLSLDVGSIKTWRETATAQINFLIEQNAQLRDEIYKLKKGGN